MSHPFIDPPTGLPVIVKQSLETAYLVFDFSSHLRDHAIQTVASVVFAPLERVPISSPTFYFGTPTIVDGDKVKVSCYAGAEGEAYKVTVRVEDAQYAIFEMDCVVYVVEG